MQCPAGCDASLVMSERQNVEIDYCPTCRGVWLDRGELDKIIERSTQQLNEVAAPPAPPPAYEQSQGYQQPQSQRMPMGSKGSPPPGYGQGYGYPPKKKKSFLGEMFDF
jgi:Zn-finger nucleic acid-binding protein